MAEGETITQSRGDEYIGGLNMDKQTTEFYIKKCNNEVVRVGKGIINKPKIEYNGKVTKWAEDKYIKK